jgi:Protein of unknown function (DUF4239)
VARDLLNSVPEGLLAVVFVGGVVVFSLGAFVLVSRLLPSWRNPDASQVIVGISAMAMTLFALVLAFVVVNLYSDYTAASGDVTDEANALGALVQNARAFPPQDRRSINRAVARYVREVRTREFKALADGDHDSVAEARALSIVTAVQAYTPRTATQTTFYGAATDQLNVFLGERENRVAKAGTEIPVPLLALLVFLGITTIGVSLLIQTHRSSVDVVLLVVVSVIVASGFLTALILQYPYSGSIAVKSDPLTEGPLSHVGDGT